MEYWTDTFMSTKRTIVLTPRSASHHLYSEKFWSEPEIPTSGFNCEEAMLIAAAAVNPVITGSDMKSSKKPEKKENWP